MMSTLGRSADWSTQFSPSHRPGAKLVMTTDATQEAVARAGQVARGDGYPVLIDMGWKPGTISIRMEFRPLRPEDV